MPYRNGNYAAFYVAEPFNQNNLGANCARDFCYYNLLKAWKVADRSFPFVDSHDKTYNVRDGSDWDLTLKPRLHLRLCNSQNVILFLSKETINSRALHEEIDYAINVKGLPLIIVYPEYEQVTTLNCNGKRTLKHELMNLWEKIPILRDSINKVPSIHVPMDKEQIRKSLEYSGFKVQTKMEPGQYFW